MQGTTSGVSCNRRAGGQQAAGCPAPTRRGEGQQCQGTCFRLSHQPICRAAAGGADKENRLTQGLGEKERVDEWRVDHELESQREFASDS